MMIDELAALRDLRSDVDPPTDAARRAARAALELEIADVGRAASPTPPRRTRPSRPLAVVLVLFVLSGSAAAAVLSSLGSKTSARLVGRVPGTSGTTAATPFFAYERAGDRYRITVTPVLQGGVAGLCDDVTYEPANGPGGFGSGSCDGPYPTIGQPLFGNAGQSYYPGDRIPSGGVIDYVLTGPAVAGVRVGSQATITPRSQPDLPAGDKAAVFYLPAGSPMVISPGLPAKARQRLVGDRALTLTAVGRTGHPLPGRPSPPFRLPSRFWATPEPQPRGACVLGPPALAGLVAAHGTIVRQIRAVPGVTGAAFVSCLSTSYTFRGESFEAAILLNARDPRARPRSLFGETQASGHPGIVNREFGRPRSIAPITARRTGNAWLVVQGCGNLATRIRILDALRIERIDLRGSG